MIRYLERDKEVLKMFTAADNRTIKVQPRNRAAYTIHKTALKSHYEKLLSEGFSDVTHKYFSYLVKSKGDYCIIIVDDSYRTYKIINSVGANFTCDAEGALRTYNQKIEEGYTDASELYVFREEIEVRETLPQEKYMFGLDPVINSIPLPEFYKDTVFAIFKK